MVVAFHTLSSWEVDAFLTKNVISGRTDLILTVVVAVRDAICPIDTVALHIETAERIDIAVSAAGWDVGGFDIAVRASGTGVHVDAFHTVAIFSQREAQDGNEV